MQGDPRKKLTSDIIRIVDPNEKQCVILDLPLFTCDRSTANTGTFIANVTKNVTGRFKGHILNDSVVVIQLDDPPKPVDPRFIYIPASAVLFIVLVVTLGVCCCCCCWHKKM